MGWAKYLEDDLSIFCGRMYMLEKKTDVKHHPYSSVKTEPITVPRISTKASKPRHGLELYFQVNEPQKMARKLQLHGWWWSRTNKCWCNDDLQMNRDFARKITVTTSAILRVST